MNTGILVWSRVGHDIFESGDAETAAVVRALGYLEPLRKADVSAIEVLAAAGGIEMAITAGKEKS